MTEKESSKRRKSTAKSGQTKKASQAAQDRTAQDLKQALQESEGERHAALAEVERLREERHAVDQELVQTQRMLEETQNNLEQERQARMDAEQALANAGPAREDREAERATTTVAERGGEEKRVSFILRLTINERGDPLRTEIEHAQTQVKKIIPAFEPQQVADFVRSRIRTEKEPEAKPEPQTKRPAGEAPIEGALLVLSEVRVCRPEIPGMIALNISPEEESFAQVDFQLEGTESTTLTEKRSAYEVKLYAREVSSGKATLLGEQKGELAAGITIYQSQIRIGGLEPGLYRLMATVDVPEIPGLAGYQEGHFLRVAHTMQKEEPGFPV